MDDSNSDIPVNRDGSLNEQGEEASIEHRVEDVPGSPTWPNVLPPSTLTGTPTAGLNWQVVADSIGIDARLAKHDGSIVVPGDYFIEAGYMIDPRTMRGRHVDVGDRALRPGYFLSDLTVSEFRLSIPINVQPARSLAAPRPIGGSIYGLFVD